MESFVFPSNFIWGAATAAFQIEGATTEDGRSESTWDAFCKRPGKIANNNDGRYACDHYHRYTEDVALIKSLGIPAYRFSTAWPRILPEGEGKVNQKGIDFYCRLVDELLNAGITPYITLFHWDLPQILEDNYGGWRSKETAARFADYAAVVVNALSDRVEHWMTINEIKCFTDYAYREDRHAPGTFQPEQICRQAMHNALLGHGLAMNAIRETAKKTPKVGIVENLHTFNPVFETDEHVEAAKRMFEYANRDILFPLFEGKYRDDFLKEMGDTAPVFTDEEMNVIGAKMDFIGYNIYTAWPVRSADNALGAETIPYAKGYPLTHMDWPIADDALYYAARFTKDFFGDIPIYITENGMAADELKETNENEILDVGRVNYLRGYLRGLHRAIEKGANVKGYFVWSLLDNFEWEWGYARRFGIIRVNYATFERTVKLSGTYYSNVIRANRVL